MGYIKFRFHCLILGLSLFSLSQTGHSKVGARFNEFNRYIVDGVYFGESEFRFFDYRRPRAVSLRNFPQTERQKVINRVSQKIPILYKSQDKGLQLTLDRAIDLYGESELGYASSAVGYAINTAVLGPTNEIFRGIEILIDGQGKDRHIHAFYFTKHKNVYKEVSCSVHAIKPRFKAAQLVDVNYCTLRPIIRSEGHPAEYIVFKKGAGPLSGWANPPEK